MKRILIISFIIVAIQCSAQETSQDNARAVAGLKRNYAALKGENAKLQSQLNVVTKSTTALQIKLDSIGKQVQANVLDLQQTNSELGGKIQQTGKNSDQKISALDNTLSKNTLYWIIAFLATLVVSALIYVLLGKRLIADKISMQDQLSATKKSLEEEGIKLDTKLTEVLETQLKLVQQERSLKPESVGTIEPDHSLALKVADEITRINKNLSAMDSGTRGLKQLAGSVKRIEENFAANGYEMPVLLNQPFHQGMKLVVTNSIPDETLKAGEERISRIIKPQVNYHGIMIQSAQVEVSIGQ